jgi:hypothetical protein
MIVIAIVSFFVIFGCMLLLLYVFSDEFEPVVLRVEELENGDCNIFVFDGHEVIEFTGNCYCWKYAETKELAPIKYSSWLTDKAYEYRSNK